MKHPPICLFWKFIKMILTPSLPFLSTYHSLLTGISKMMTGVYEVYKFILHNAYTAPQGAEPLTLIYTLFLCI